MEHGEKRHIIIAQSQRHIEWGEEKGREENIDDDRISAPDPAHGEKTNDDVEMDRQ